MQVLRVGMAPRFLRGLLPLLIALVVACVCPTLAHAAEEAEESSGGLFGPAWGLNLGLWTVVVFLLLLFILGKYAWTPMLQGLHKREETIHGAIAEAHRAKEEAQRLQAQWLESMAKAEDRVREIHEEARQKAQQIADDIQSKARADIQSERERLHREIERARDQALQELWAQTAQLATMVSSKAIRRQLSPEDHRRLVDEALAELGRASAGNAG